MRFCVRKLTHAIMLLLTKAVLPYKRHIPSILQMTSEEQDGLAKMLKKVLVRYDNLFS